MTGIYCFQYTEQPKQDILKLNGTRGGILKGFDVSGWNYELDTFLLSLVMNYAKVKRFLNLNKKISSHVLTKASTYKNITVS